jgi:hypothetical protein
MIVHILQLSGAFFFFPWALWKKKPGVLHPCVLCLHFDSIKLKHSIFVLTQKFVVKHVYSFKVILDVFSLIDLIFSAVLDLHNKWADNV